MLLMSFSMSSDIYFMAFMYALSFKSSWVSNSSMSTFFSSMILLQASFWALISYKDIAVTFNCQFKNERVQTTYLVKFFAVFLFLELLPVPVDFDVFLVGADNFVLDLVGSLLFVLLLESAASCLSLIGLSLDLVDCLVSFLGQLDKLAWRERGLRSCSVNCMGVTYFSLRQSSCHPSQGSPSAQLAASCLLAFECLFFNYKLYILSSI